MTDPSTTTIAVSSRDESTGDTLFTPEMVSELSQRVGLGALIYGGTWLVMHGYYVTRHALTDPARLADYFHHTIFLLALATSALVYRTTRKGSCTPQGLSRMAMQFMILGSLWISSSLWKCGDRFAADFEKWAQAAGTADAIALANRMSAEGFHPFPVEGPTWVAIWLLAFPFIYPMSPRRITIAALASTATIPVVMLTSRAVHGWPETVGRWMGGLMVDLSIQTLVCAGIAIAVATRVHALTRDLARERAMGSYQLVERIGAGGMGEVWRAHHRMLVRPAAIKLIKPAGGSNGDGDRGRRGIRPKSSSSVPDTLLKRFEREAQATANLTSPHTIEVYDFGVTADGTFYYVMELLDGLDLATLVEKHGPVPPARAIHFLEQACHSLADAHANQLVHRDVKPANLFTCRRGSDLDVVKVLDFGLVKDVERSPESTRLTTEGSTTGTPAFMAPEMVYGHHGVDGRSDLYALGCVGYWLLTGELVFDADSPMAMLVRHAKDDPVPPSQRGEVKVPADLERVILDCLAKDPDARPPSAEVLAEKLRACTDHGKWSAERARAWWAERPALGASPPAPVA